MIILDTNVISALMTPGLNARTVEWLDRQRRSDVWTTAVSVFEIRSGLLAMPEGKRRRALTIGFEHLMSGLFLKRVLPLDSDAAELASELAVRRTRAGQNVDLPDTYIAGIVLSRDASIATRNTRHFQDLGGRVIDPWNMPSSI